MAALMSGQRHAKVLIDRTHLGRRASGIERITEELFSAEVLAPLAVGGVNAGPGKLAMLLAQQARNPFAAWQRPDSVWVFPGYPPSPLFSLMRDRSVLYVHDLFLMTRRDELNRSAKIYMAAPFRLALRRFRHFFVNSLTTGVLLARHVAPGACIVPYRPRVRNVFGLAQGGTDAHNDRKRPLVVGAIGTVEPRKNFRAAAAVCRALAERLGRPVELHIVGRCGWGGDFAALAALPHVRLHGFVADDAIAAVVSSFDLYLCTSHDEGLGLPLIEVQYGGIPVIAPDQAVFREVLGESGIYIHPDDPEGAAAAIAQIVNAPVWRLSHAAMAARNVERWNETAEADRRAVIDFLAALLERVANK